MEKTGGKKSRATIPLNGLSNRHTVRRMWCQSVCTVLVLWRRDPSCNIVDPSSYNQHKSISGQYCQEYAVRMSEMRQLVCSAPFFRPAA